MVNQVVWAWVGEDAAGRAAGGGGGKCATICVVTRHYDAEMVPLGPWSLSGGYQTSCEEQAPKLSVVLALETSPWYHGDRSPGAFCDIQVPWWPPSLDPWRDGLTETATTYKEDCCCFFSHEVMSDSCGTMDCSPPGSSVHGIFQARILEWVAISFSRGSSQPRDHTWVSSFGRWGFFTTVWEAPIDKTVVVQLLSRVWLFVTPWTAACQASLSFTIS